MTAALKVAIFDDVVFARGEQFRIPGLDIAVLPHADDAVRAISRTRFDMVLASGIW